VDVPRSENNEKEKEYKEKTHANEKANEAEWDDNFVMEMTDALI